MEVGRGPEVGSPGDREPGEYQGAEGGNKGEGIARGQEWREWG